jgi:hypothetical protein
MSTQTKTKPSLVMNPNRYSNFIFYEDGGKFKLHYQKYDVGGLPVSVTKDVDEATAEIIVAASEAGKDELRRELKSLLEIKER